MKEMPKSECKIVLERPPDCEDVHKKRSYAACYAWNLMKEGRTRSFGEGLRMGWERVKKLCAT